MAKKTAPAPSAPLAGPINLAPTDWFLAPWRKTPPLPRPAPAPCRGPPEYGPPSWAQLLAGQNEIKLLSHSFHRASYKRLRPSSRGDENAIKSVMTAFARRTASLISSRITRSSSPVCLRSFCFCPS